MRRFNAVRAGLGLLFELSGRCCYRVVLSIYPSVDSLTWGGGEVAGLLLDGLDGGSLQMTTARLAGPLLEPRFVKVSTSHYGASAKRVPG